MGLGFDSWVVDCGWDLVFISNSWCDSGSCEVSVLWFSEWWWIMIMNYDSWFLSWCCKLILGGWVWWWFVYDCDWASSMGVILILGFGSRQTAVMLGVWIVIDCCNGDLGLLVVSVWVWFLRWVVILVWGCLGVSWWLWRDYGVWVWLLVGSGYWWFGVLGSGSSVFFDVS